MDRKKILIVDDDVAVQQSLKHVLNYGGYEIATASNGEEGLRLLREVKPCLVILDMKMPGMSGTGFLKAITGADGKPEYPVLVLTAHANMKTFFDNLDIAGFMLKPCSTDDLLREVSRILAARKSSSDQLASQLHLGTRRVLIAEDEEAHIRRIRDAFLHEGFVVEQVENGSDAIGIAILNMPDVMVLKELLPQLSGRAVAVILQGIPKTQNIPVILYDDSNYLPTLDENALESKGVRLIVRSNGSAELLSAVNRVLRG